MNQLVKDFQNGDQKKFDEIVLLNKDWMIDMIYNMTYNKQDSEDISQDVFVNLFFSIKKFKGNSSFKTWVYRIVINKVNDYYRKLKMRNFFNFELSEIDESKIYKDNEDDIFLNFDKQLMFRSIVSLKGKQRTVLLLRIYQSHSFKEISKLLNINENNAKVMFFQAKKTLINKLSKHGK
jgi:RNA polymerase sigma-70 factor (ECF subfamily)